MHITIAGTGYVGLVTAAVLAHIGHTVVCVDIDQGKIDRLNAGECVIFEPGLAELLAANRERLHFSSDCRMAYRQSEIIFIAVGTPEKADGSANLKFVNDVVEQIIEEVERNCIVVIKSTVPVCTNDRIQQYIKRRIKNRITVEVVSNPEFLSQGTAVYDMLHASRIVIGAESQYAQDTMQHIYENMECPVFVTDRCSAEMIKYASNDFLALKISYINEIANLCECVGADIGDVSHGMGLDPRIGNRFLKAGIGYGGSCFPKDTKALHWLSNFHDQEIKTVKAAVEVNSNQKIRLIKKARKYYNSLEGLTVAVLGLAFKPGTDDLREAPSLDCVSILLDSGAQVRAWDPVAADNFKKFFGHISYCNSIQEALEGADVCFILTEWPEVIALDPAMFLSMRVPVILDGRNCFDLKKIGEYPLIYDSIGRRTIRNIPLAAVLTDE